MRAVDTEMDTNASNAQPGVGPTKDFFQNFSNAFESTSAQTVISYGTFTKPKRNCEHEAAT
jgi:hypothetical protein